jgi:hypothetical protein
MSLKVAVAALFLLLLWKRSHQGLHAVFMKTVSTAVRAVSCGPNEESSNSTNSV